MHDNSPSDTCLSEQSSRHSRDAVIPAVSILIPIYNVETYLEQCLASICAQTLQEIEIICINDGSTDGSLDIITAFAARDDRIVVIDKPNAGYGHSMNRGLEQARGEYIGIVESDDYVDRDMFESLYRAALENDAQVVKSDFYLTWTTPTLKERYFNAVPAEQADSAVVPWRSFQVMQPQPAIWSALYKRSFLARFGIDFLESPGAAYQDTSFNYAVWSAADRPYLLKRALIHYRQDNAGSSINASAKTHEITKEIDRYFAWLNAQNDLENLTERKQALTRIMQGIVYKTYRWNLIRIVPGEREGFLAFMHKYFVEAEKKGQLEERYFELDYYNELQLLLKNPQRYLQIVAGTGAANKLRRLLYYVQQEGVPSTIKRVFHA
ncbi:MAG TPA: glycosyl transferase family 2 [Coriobacteriia bacterium]|nr:glycosyl transferase family 2 [Coriobacteriia bacterium]